MHFFSVQMSLKSKVTMDYITKTTSEILKSHVVYNEILMSNEGEIL